MTFKLLVLIATNIFLMSCASATLIVDSKDQVLGIPYESPAVIVDVNYSADSLYRVINSNLIKFNWIVRDSGSLRYMSCDTRKLKGRVNVQPIIRIQKVEEGKSRALFMGRFTEGNAVLDEIISPNDPKTNDAKQIKWMGYRTRAGYAFQHLIRIAIKTPGGTVNYLPKQSNVVATTENR